MLNEAEFGYLAGVQRLVWGMFGFVRVAEVHFLKYVGKSYLYITFYKKGYILILSYLNRYIFLNNFWNSGTENVNNT